MGKGLKKVVGAAKDLVSGAVDAVGGVLKPDTPGEGKSAMQMQAEAKVKADKETASRSAAMARNKSVFADDDDTPLTSIRTAGKSVLTKKLG